MLFFFTLLGVAFSQETIGGLPLDTKYLETRKILDKRITANETAYISTYTDPTNLFTVSILCDPKDLQLFEETGDYALKCNFSYTSSQELSLQFTSDYPVSVDLAILFTHNLSVSNGIGENLSIPLMISQLGDAYVIARVSDVAEPYVTVGIRIVVLRKSGILDIIFRAGLIILLILATFFMGCEVDIGIIKSYLKKPIGPILGFFCQFVIMPAMAIMLAKLTPLNPAFAFGLFISGCCPGGGASNVWTRLLGGDLNLSLVMTLLSSLSALVMLPLYLFAFSRFFNAIDTSAVPYGPIVVNLLYLFIPVTAGLLVSRFRPTWAEKLRRGVQPTSCIFLVYVIAFGTFVNFSVFRLLARYPLIIAVCAALPLTGYLFGFLMALLCRRPWPVVVAISIETGVQNLGVGILILLSAIPQPQGDLGSLMPITIALATPPCLLIALIVRIIVRRVNRGKNGSWEEEEWESKGASPTSFNSGKESGIMAEDGNRGSDK